jgi:hypothetical protein
LGPGLLPCEVMESCTGRPHDLSAGHPWCDAPGQGDSQEAVFLPNKSMT